MFSSLKVELAQRSAQVSELWRLVDALEKKEIASHVVEPGLRTLKGLLFVHIFAVYEYAITNSFAAVVRQFNTHSLRYVDVKRPVLALALDSEFKSIANLSDRRSWPTKIDLLSRANCGDTVTIPDTLFPRDETHYRPAQLKVICITLGLPSGALIPDPRLIGWINEVVENRNRVAHGRETAEAVGGRYSSADLDVRRMHMDQICNHIVAVLEAHANVAANFH
jgi:hypothetical protein